MRAGGGSAGEAWPSGQTGRWLRLCDALILDLSLPDGDGDGNELLQALRAAGATLPVLIITARDSPQDRLKGFDTGADDYLIKPFEIPQLLVRLRAIVRPSSGTMDAAEHVWSAGAITVDEARMHATRAELEKRALPHSDRQTLDVHIFNLRKKIGESAIRTVRGVGYMVQG